MESLDDTLEPEQSDSSKDPSGSSKPSPPKQKNGHICNGVRLYTCACRFKDCRTITRFWCENPTPASENDTAGSEHGANNNAQPRHAKRAGYVSISVYKDPTTPPRHFKFDRRKCYWNHLIPFGTDHPNSPTGKKPPKRIYIANHHFPDEFLDEHGSGPTVTVDENTAKRIGLTDADKVKDGHWENESQRGTYFLPPIVKPKAIVEDFIRSGGNPNKLSEDSRQFVSERQSGRATGQLRVDTRREPTERKLGILEAKAKSDPRAFAWEFLRMEEEVIAIRGQIQGLRSKQKKDKEEKKKLRLQLKEALEKIEFLESSAAKSISRANLSSPDWHQRHPEASKHLFGFAWQHLVIFVMEVAFPRVALAGGVGRIAPFEKIMMAMMRAQRGYDLKTIGYFFDVSDGTVSVYVNEWMPRLGELGRAMSILDMDLKHDYVTEEYARANNVAHSRIMN